jgi:hypothetical protein
MKSLNILNYVIVAAIIILIVHILMDNPTQLYPDCWNDCGQ